MSKKPYSELKNLGKNNKTINAPNDSILEKVKNPHSEIYNIRLSVPEFTSICPVTGQPDFAFFLIDYVPNKWIVESKSFKLFLFSFRNYGGFHEECTIKIAKSVEKSIKPKWLRIAGFWNPRGGIPIDIFYQNGKKPKDIHLEDFKINTYSGR